MSKQTASSTGRRVRTAVALTALAIYFWMKYTAGGVGFSLAYLQQVTVIVVLTAILPYLVPRLLERFDSIRWPARLVLPSLLACAGYWVFFTIAIAPYAPDASALPVVLRGLVPGVVISLLLSIPSIFDAVFRNRSSSAGPVRKAGSVASVAVLVLAGLSTGGEASNGDRFDDAPDVLVSVQMQRLVSGHQVVRASLNGVDVQLIVDTGSEALSVDDDALERLGIDASQVLETSRGAGISGPFEFTKHPVDSLRIGGVELVVPSAVATDLDPVITGLANATGVRVDGILGQEVLVAHAAILEMDTDRLHLRRPVRAAFTTPQMELAGYRAVLLEPMANGMAAVDVAINGAGAKLVLDSGARVSILDRNGLVRWALNGPADAASVGGAGGGGRIGIRQHPVESVHVGGEPVALRQIASVDFKALVEVLQERGGQTIDGVVGLDILWPHRAVIDLGAGVLHLADPQEVAVVGR